MTADKLAEALLHIKQAGDPARLSETAHIEYCRAASIVQGWCNEDGLRKLLALHEAEKQEPDRLDAERYRWLRLNLTRLSITTDHVCMGKDFDGKLDLKTAVRSIDVFLHYREVLPDTVDSAIDAAKEVKP